MSEPHGTGVFVAYGWTYEGTFVNGIIHGYCDVSGPPNGLRTIGEMSQGEWVNKQTVYT